MQGRRPPQNIEEYHAFNTSNCSDQKVEVVELEDLSSLAVTLCHERPAHCLFANIIHNLQRKRVAQ